MLAHLVADAQVELAVGLDVDRIRAPAVERRGQELVAPVVGRADLPRPLVVEADQVGRVAQAQQGELVAEVVVVVGQRSEEHTSELQSLMRNSYAVFCLKKKNKHTPMTNTTKKTTHY